MIIVLVVILVVWGLVWVFFPDLRWHLWRRLRRSPPPVQVRQKDPTVWLAFWQAEVDEMGDTWPYTDDTYVLAREAADNWVDRPGYMAGLSCANAAAYWSRAR